MHQYQQQHKQWEKQRWILVIHTFVSMIQIFHIESKIQLVIDIKSQMFYIEILTHILQTQSQKLERYE
jgi:hypothetical protein